MADQPTDSRGETADSRTDPSRSEGQPSGRTDPGVLPPAPAAGSIAPQPEQRENLGLNLLFNAALPAVLLMKGDDWIGWAPEFNLVAALAFPAGYAIRDYLRRRKLNFFSVMGFVGVLLTGGIGLLKLPPEMVAVKEAAIPLALGLVVLLTAGSSKPLTKLLLMNEAIMDIPKVERRLEQRGNLTAFQRLMKRATFWVAASFLVSAILNFILAKWIVTTDPGIDAAQFNEELGQMQIWSYPVIAVPTMAITIYAFWYLMRGLTDLTGLSLEEMFHSSVLEKKRK